LSDGFFSNLRSKRVALEGSTQRWYVPEMIGTYLSILVAKERNDLSKGLHGRAPGDDLTAINRQKPKPLVRNATHVADYLTANYHGKLYPCTWYYRLFQYDGLKSRGQVQESEHRSVDGRIQGLMIFHFDFSNFRVLSAYMSSLVLHS
jgi:hypothetical protein